MSGNAPYTILPFRFGEIDNIKLITNDAGEFHFLSEKYFNYYTNYFLDKDSQLFHNLKSKQFLTDTDVSLPIELISTKLRSKKSFLNHFTSLHMIVITLRCNHNCRYCQALSEDDLSHEYDMSIDNAKKIVEFIFQSPSNEIKIEFQGGEPILNWNTIVETVNHANDLNRIYNKNLEFVICTNLTLIDEEKIDFVIKNGIYLSTSLDGNKELHDEYRKLRVGKSSYDLFREKLDLVRKYSLKDKVSPLLTITSKNINRITEVIDEYVSLNFDGIFFRALNPYGSAIKNESEVGYSIDNFLECYEKGLDHIISINLDGIHFMEYYTNLILQRILTPFGTSFVDLQSPSGAGISGAIYDYNGDVYPADEARMLARMGDTHFLMGNVNNDNYNDVFSGKVIKDIVSKSITEIMPECSYCVYQPYCGADPIRNYLQTKDVVGHRPSSDFCEKHKGIFKIIFKKLYEDDNDVMNVFWSWINNRRIGEDCFENF